MPLELSAALLVLGAVALLVYAYLRRGICGLRVSRGVVRADYGAAPPSVVGDVQDALRGSTASGWITILGGGKFARVAFVGTFTENQQQRVRNVLGNVSTTRFRRS